MEEDKGEERMVVGGKGKDGKLNEGERRATFLSFP